MESARRLPRRGRTICAEGTHSVQEWRIYREEGALEQEFSILGLCVEEPVGVGRIRGCDRDSIPRHPLYHLYGGANPEWRGRVRRYKHLGSERAHYTK